MRHKETEPNGAKGKSLQEKVVKRCEWKRNTKGKVGERKTLGERKRSERRSDREMESALARRGYLCLGVIGTAGRLLKGSLIQSVREERVAVERRLKEQRAQNCSIRLSRESYSKNEC